MSTAKTWQISSLNSGDTEAFAATFGQKLRGGEVIELVSDIGGGKTTFVRGLAKGLGSTDQVSSPTYTINQIYQAGTKEIHHYDFYRLQEAGVVGDELREEMGQPNVVTVIEWGDIVHNVLPEDKITITFKRMSENDDRLLTVAVPESHSYLSEGTEA